jgi:hypothetical protein
MAQPNGDPVTTIKIADAYENASLIVSTTGARVPTNLTCTTMPDTRMALITRLFVLERVDVLKEYMDR